MKLYGIKYLVLFIIVLVSCTPPKRLQSVLVEDYVEKLIDNKIRFIKGWGDVEISVNGDRHNGSADLVQSDSTFEISMYSPFGNLIVNVSCGSEKCVIALPESTLYVQSDDLMTGLPFSWTEGITYREFMEFVSSRFGFFSDLLLTQPDTSENKNLFIFSWKNSVSEINLEVNRRTGFINKIECKPKINHKMTIQFSDFSGEKARKVKFYSDDKNYFVLNLNAVIDRRE